MTKPLITVIAPMYNEEVIVQEYAETTLSVLRSMRERYNSEILFVNDGSRDKTLEKMSDVQKIYPEEIGIVNLSRNFGLEGAISAGLRSARGDIVVVMDADLQDPPSLIIEMVKKYENGADIVVGSRVSRSSDTFFKKITANIYYGILGYLSGKLKLEKSAANYRLLSRRAVDKILELPEVNVTFRVVVPFIGMKTDTVAYERVSRAAGKTKYNFKSLIRCALDGVTSISVEPLRKLFWFLLIALMIAIGSGTGVMFVNSEWRPVLFLLFINAVFFSFLFFCLILIAEYVGQIMVEVKHRPTSIIYEYKPSNNSSKL